MRALILGAAASAALLCLAAPARAQSDLRPGAITSGAPRVPRPEAAPAEPPPSAVPGAKPRTDSVAPADRAAADLPPTEALFDAINRGDIGSARDALSRGADLDGTNLLGLTPTELSVDLSRNDITFLLLSMRGGGGGQRGPSQSADASLLPDGATSRRKPRPAPVRPVRVAAPAAVRSQSPALFANNGGAAIPSVGFLGFNPTK